MPDYNEYVYAVYREGGFSKAAKKLYVSQPWLSAAIKKVEQELKTVLFDRSTTPVTLTEAGRYYIGQIEKIMCIEKETREHFSALNSLSDARVHLGSSMFFCTYVLPLLLADFRAQYPQAALTFSEGATDVLVQKLASGEIDFLLEAEDPKLKDIRTLPWSSEEIVLAVPAKFRVNDALSDCRYSFEAFLRRNEPGGRKPPVDLRAFAAEPFLFLKEGNDGFTRSMKLCRNAGFTPDIKLYLTQMMTAYYLVCEGQGVAFLRSTIPEYVTPTESLCFYQLSDPLAVRSIYLSYPKGNIRPIQQRLIDFMTERGSAPASV